MTWPEKAIGFRAPGAYIQDPKGLERVMKKKAEQEWKRKERRERIIERGRTRSMSKKTHREVQIS